MTDQTRYLTGEGTEAFKRAIDEAKRTADEIMKASNIDRVEEAMRRLREEGWTLEDLALLCACSARPFADNEKQTGKLTGTWTMAIQLVARVIAAADRLADAGKLTDEDKPTDLAGMTPAGKA